MSAESMPKTARLTDYLYDKATILRIPLSGTFELSPVCNFDCRMCYVRKSQAEVNASPRPIMTLDQWLQIAEDAHKQGLLYLLLTGGEPLLWPDFWTLYEVLSRMGFLLSINTNGSLIDRRAIDFFRQWPPRKINLTLYGASDAAYQRLCGISGQFDKVDRAVTMLQEAQLPVKLNCSVTPYNAEDLDQILLYADEHHLRLDADSYMFPPIRRDIRQVGNNEGRFSPEEAAAYRMKIYQKQNSEPQYHKFLLDLLSGTSEPPGLDDSCVDPVDGTVRCRAGKASFWITWDGWMTPCGMMTEPRSDLYELSFPQAWENTVANTAALRLSGLCSECPNLKLCHPCAAIACAETGSPAGVPEYLCRVSRELQRLAALELKHH